MTDPLSYLHIYLGPFRDALARPDVTDLYVNRPGEFWLETLGGRIERVEAAEVGEAQLWRLARQVASITHQGISREHPLLSATLPDGARVQVVAPPATRSSVALAIRKHVSPRLNLADYAEQGAFATTRSGRADDPADAELARSYGAGDWHRFLAEAVRARRTIIVSGGTSTGKTTFLNALVREIPDEERLVLIEDVPEIEVPQPNVLGLVAVRSALGETDVSTDDLLAASLRLRPDRIILGELRGAEAFTFLRAINTGHPGSLTTVHADTPERAVEQLALMVLQRGVNMRREDIVRYVHEIVDIIVQLERRAGRRSIARITWRWSERAATAEAPARHR